MLQLLKRKTEQQLVAEIHAEFDTAEDRLLKRADALLYEMDLQTEESIKSKADRLVKLGFINTSPVKWLKDNSLIKTREDAELIRYYKEAYPFQKFLTEDELDRICKKYNLIHAPVAHYKKDVPDKNIEEIERAAKLHREDVATDRLIFRYTSSGNFTWHEKIKLMRGVEIDRDMGNNSLNASQGLGRKVITTYEIISGNITKINKQGLFICAPKSHFDLRGLNQSSQFSFKSFIVEEPKDPIVFRYVRGGVQVLSKWGLEASDESLVNEINN